MKPNSGLPRAPWAARWGLAIVVGMALLVLTACLGSLWYAESEGRRAIAAQERQTVDSELDVLEIIGAEEHAGGLVRAIAWRARAEGLSKHRLYAAMNAEGDLLAGNLAAWPDGLGPDEDWRAAVDELSGRPVHVSTRTVDGVALLVGRDDAALETFRRDVLGAVWVAVAVVAVTCLAIAVAISAYILSRVRRLSEVATRVAAGDFSARAASVGEGGPFGEIALAQNTMLDRIEELVTGLTTVTDSLAHDLRTPLARTRRRLEAGLATTDTEARQMALEGALAETDRTIAAFGSLIDIARADGGLSRDTMATIDLDRLAHDVFDLFEPLAQERRLTLSVQADASATILGHRPLLMQALSNLVHNAIKHAPPHSSVRVEVVDRPEQVELVVADEGPGIPAEHRQAARQRFKQVREDAPEGLGLGLAIVDACARLHRGALVLEDNEPCGLRARLALSKR